MKKLLVHANPQISVPTMAYVSMEHASVTRATQDSIVVKLAF